MMPQCFQELSFFLHPSQTHLGGLKLQEVELMVSYNYHPKVLKKTVSSLPKPVTLGSTEICCCFQLLSDV